LIDAGVCAADSLVMQNEKTPVQPTDAHPILANVLAISLVVGGVVAEFSLLRMFLADWRDGTQAEKARARRRRSGGLWAGAAVCGLLGHGVCADEPAPVDQNALIQTSPAPSSALVDVAAKPLVISTDRPGFCDTAGIVPKGHFQLETGYTFTLRDREGTNSQTNNAPEILARYTIIEDRLELRVSTSGYVWNRTNDGTGAQTAEGWSDVLPGVKLKLTDQDGMLPRLVLEGATTTSVGSDGISNQDIEPIFKLIWAYDLGKGWGVYGNFNVAYASTSGDRFVQGQGGVCVTYAANDKVSFFGEYFVFGPNAKGTDAAHYLDFGAAYLLTNRVQLDVRAGFGLNNQANNFFTGAGISFLF
jgi:hypothetical protein